MARMLQLRDVVPRQNLRVWLAMKEGLNNPFTHE